MAGALKTTLWAGIACAAALQPSSMGNGINRDGVGARSMSLGGADAATASGALGAMGANPAGLSLLQRPEAQLGFIGGIASGEYRKNPGVSGELDGTFGALPEAAGAYRLENAPVVFGLSFVPDSLLLADWNYLDAPGGLGGAASYGVQEHRSEIVVLRSALGAAVQLHPTFSFGASIGLLYNENTLRAPYAFQNLEPASAAGVNGGKTLLDLETSGYGWNAQIGLLYAPLTNLQFGLTYKSKAEVSSNGDASGDPYAQFGVAPGPLAFHYDANVRNTFPHEIAAGLAWQAHPKWRIALQVDWLNWADAFNTLPVRLRNGSNATVNGVLGANVQDNIPLRWKDRFVYRLGVEHALCEGLFLRAGYAYGSSPAPDETLTPMTAAIMEHMVSAGAGFERGSWGLDVAWQHDLPTEQSVGASDLRSGEYSNSVVDVSVHRVALTARYRF